MRLRRAEPGRAVVLALAAALTSLLTALVCLTGCSDDADQPARTTSVRPHWEPVTLPFPPGPPGRLALRDAATCAGHWYVVGAVLGANGASRPAAWTSTDGSTWQAVRLDPHQYYARRAILYGVACRGDQVAVLGAKAGGAHFMPRTITWYLRPDGVLTDAHAPSELFGGPATISVRRIAAGPRGWLVAGTRSSGAAAWTSADGTRFTLHEQAPALSSGPDEQTRALDAVADADGWTVVGGVQGDEDGTVAWTSPDGQHWTRQQVPAGTTGFAELERVAARSAGDGLVAAGLRQDRFGLWERTGGRWRAAASFGRVDETGGGAPYVSGLAVTPETVLAAISDGTRFGLWARRDGWARVTVPVRPATSGDAQLTVTARGGTVLLVTDDGRTGRLWRTTLP